MLVTKAALAVVMATHMIKVTVGVTGARGSTVLTAAAAATGLEPGNAGKSS